MSDEKAGRLGARTYVNGLPARSPKQAVSELTEYCLQHEGHHDDVTALVVDATLLFKSRAELLF